MSVTFLTSEDEKAFVKSINGVKPDPETGDVVVPSSGGNVDQSGLSSTAANLLIEILRNGVYSTDQSENITALAAELAVTEEEPDTPGEPDEPDDPVTPEVTLSSISATYSGGDVPVGTAVTALTGVVVTAHYSDGTSETVTGYTLSGEIAEGENTVTVTYHGKTTTFTVTGVAESGGDDDQPTIPADATKLAYIESSGTQYIDTGAKVHWNNEAFMSADTSAVTASCYLFGANDGTYSAFLNPFRNATVTKFGWPGKEGNGQNTSYCGENLEINITHFYQSLGDYRYTFARSNLGDDASVYIGEAETVGTSANLYLFAHNNNGTATNHASFKLKEFILYTDSTRETEIIHLIPVLDPDGVVCMYDAVSKQYFRNSGTGDFVGGDAA